MTLQKLPRKLKTLPHEIPNTFELKFETLSQERLKRSHEIRKKTFSTTILKPFRMKFETPFA